MNVVPSSEATSQSKTDLRGAPPQGAPTSSSPTATPIQSTPTRIVSTPSPICSNTSCKKVAKTKCPICQQQNKEPYWVCSQVFLHINSFYVFLFVVSIIITTVTTIYSYFCQYFTHRNVLVCCGPHIIQHIPWLFNRRLHLLQLNRFHLPRYLLLFRKLQQQEQPHRLQEVLNHLISLLLAQTFRRLCQANPHRQHLHQVKLQSLQL